MDHPTRTLVDSNATASVGEHTTADRRSGESDGELAAPPGFDLLVQVGRGGMGVVFRARDLELDREVAVKILLPKYGVGSITAKRFVGEARITGQLQHPGVPPVYRVGELADGRPFLAMKLIKGQTLDVLLKGQGAGAAKWLGVFEAICQAVGYAHAHGVIHRDLKPANVKVGAFGEVQVMDWGLAKVLGERRDFSPPVDQDPDATATPDPTEIKSLRDADLLTQYGSILGTPAFMAPEQAIGAIGQIDRRTDVFGLGAILCALLTGQPPYVGDTAESTRQLAARAKLDDAVARLGSCGAEPDLVVLCKRCLSAEQADRPVDASEVATAVAALRAAADERARQAELDRVKAEGVREKAEVQAAEQRKRRKVQRTLAGVAAGLLVAVGCGAAVAVLWQRAERAKGEAETAQGLAEQARDKEAVTRGEAEKQKAEADRQRDKFERFEYGWKMQAAHRHWQEFNLPTTVAMLNDTRPELRGWEWQYLKRLCDNSTLTLRGHGPAVEAARWSPDGKQVVTVGGGKVQVWDAERGESVRSFEVNPRYGFKCVAGWTPDGSRFAVVECNGKVRVWSTVDWVERVVTPGVRDDQIRQRFAMGWCPFSVVGGIAGLVRCCG